MSLMKGKVRRVLSSCYAISSCSVGEENGVMSLDSSVGEWGQAPGE